MNMYWLGILSYLSGINAYMLPSLLSRFIFCVWLTWAAMFDVRLAAKDLHRFDCYKTCLLKVKVLKFLNWQRSRHNACYTDNIYRPLI